VATFEVNYSGPPSEMRLAGGVQRFASVAANPTRLAMDHSGAQVLSNARAAGIGNLRDFKHVICFDICSPGPNLGPSSTFLAANPAKLTEKDFSEFIAFAG